jgi:branched-chain amino acid transport system permease protein
MTELLTDRRKQAVLVILTVLTLAYPFLAPNDYLLEVGLLVMMWVALGSAWNMIGGYVGYVSFGHVAFFGLGMFTAAILVKRGGLATSVAGPGGVLAFLVVVLASGLVAVLVASAIAYPVLRLRGHYFAIAMLGVAEALFAIFRNVDWLKGSEGWYMPILDPGYVEGMTFLYYAMALVALLTVLTAWQVKRRKLGYGLTAIREGEEAAKMLGVPVTRYKIVAFVVSTFFPGMVGAVYAYYVSYVIDVEAFTVLKTIDMIVVTLIGGLGTVVGPIVGAVVFIGIQKVLLSDFLAWHMFATGLLILVVVLVAPGGLVGLYDDYVRGDEEIRGVHVGDLLEDVLPSGEETPEGGEKG